eukprot:scaffold4853_cov105-Isochrysis_galbana.AAC.5
MRGGRLVAQVQVAGGGYIARSATQHRSFIFARQKARSAERSQRAQSESAVPTVSESALSEGTRTL